MTTPQLLPPAMRDAFVARLAAITPVYGPTLKAHPAEVACLPALPLYPAVKLYRVSAGLRRRPVILLVAECRQSLVLLGTPEGIAELNKLVGFKLTAAEQVADYLRFWLRSSGRRIQMLVESAADFNWLPDAADDPDRAARRDRAARLARPIAVGSPADGGWPAAATVLNQRTLEAVRFRVLPDGTVAEQERSAIMEQVPVPYVMP